MKHSQNTPSELRNTGVKELDFFSTQVFHAQYYYQTLIPAQEDVLVVVCGGLETCRPDYAITRNHFRYHSIELVTAGRGTLTLANESYPLRPGILFSYGPNRPHAIRTDPEHPLTKHFVDFTGYAAESFLQQSACREGPVQISNLMSLVDTLRDIECSANRDTAESKDICTLLLRILAKRIAEAVVPLSPTHDQALCSYQRCRQIIETQYLQLQTLEEISRICQIAPEYICRLFQRFGDASPARYLTRLRMKYAANRLQDPSTLIQDVAAELAYADPFHFSRAFKRIHGMSPREFRTLASRGIHPDTKGPSPRAKAL